MRLTVTDLLRWTLAALLASCVLAASARAQDGWVRLATSTIDLAPGKAVIELPSNAIRSHAVRLAVTAGAVQLTRVRLAYGNGQVHFEERVASLAAGQAFPPLDQRAESLIVAAVTLVFVPAPGKATVEVWGQTEPPRLNPLVAAASERTNETLSAKAPRPQAAPPGFSPDLSIGTSSAGAADEDKAAGPRGGGMPDATAEDGAAAPAGTPSKKKRASAPRPTPPPSAMATEPSAPRSVAPPPPPPPSPSPATPAPAPGAQSAPASAPAATQKFTGYPVLFGTTRERDDDRIKNGRKLASFTGELDETRSLTFGKSIVTIPLERAVGSIPRPEIDLIVTRVALRAEDPNRDFTIAAVDVMSSDEFSAEVSRMAREAKSFRRQAFVFVHGYNVSFDDAMFRTAQIAYDLGFDGPAIAFSWPSRGGMWDYRHDIDTSSASRDGLRQFLEIVARQTGVDAVNIVAHSMGNAPLVDVLGTNADIARSGGKVPDLKLHEIVLAAPDVSRDNFIQFANKLKGVTTIPLTLYASQNDLAMQVSRRFSGIVRAGDVPSTGPLIVDGVETIDISDASLGMFSTNHTTFAEREQLVADIRAMFAADTHPPDTRSRTYRAFGAAPRQWWRFFKS